VKPILHDIERACGTALGGLRSLAIIDPADLSSPVRQYFAPSVPEVALLTGKRSYSIAHTLTAGQYSERTNTATRAGDFYETSVNFSIKKIRFEVENLAEKLRNRRVHVLITDNEGLKKLCINMRLATETNSGGRLGERSGYQFTFSGRREKKNPILLGYVSSGTIDFSGDYHLFFQDVNGQYYHLTVDGFGTLHTTEADPNLYSNVVIIAPPYGITVSTLGALITP
jgi:hypothetical protein